MVMRRPSGRNFYRLNVLPIRIRPSGNAVTISRPRPVLLSSARNSQRTSASSLECHDICAITIFRESPRTRAHPRTRGGDGSSRIIYPTACLFPCTSANSGQRAFNPSIFRPGVDLDGSLPKWKRKCSAGPPAEKRARQGLPTAGHHFPLLPIPPLNTPRHKDDSSPGNLARAHLPGNSCFPASKNPHRVDAEVRRNHEQERRRRPRDTRFSSSLLTVDRSLFTGIKRTKEFCIGDCRGEGEDGYARCGKFGIAAQFRGMT